MVHSESFLNSGSIDFFLLSSYFLFPSFTGQIFTICHVLMPWLLFTKYANGKSLINFQSWNKSPIPWIHTCSAKNVVQVMDKKNLAHIDINVPFKNYDDDVGVGNLLNKKKKKKNWENSKRRSIGCVLMKWGWLISVRLLPITFSEKSLWTNKCTFLEE